MNRYADGTYLLANPTWGIEDAPWKAAQVRKMLRRHDLAPRSICDVGCGAGHVLAELQSLTTAETLDGYDVSPDAERFWPAVASERLQFHRADFLAQSTPHYDLLLCLDVFEHVDDYLGFLRAIRPRATRKIFHIPLDLSVQSVMRMTPILGNRKTFGHLHYFSTETTLATLADTGYRVIDWFYTGSGTERATTAVEKVARIPRQFAALFSPRLAARFLGGFSLLVLAE